MGGKIFIRSIQDTDKDWMKKVMIKGWGSETVIASKSFNTLRLSGFIAELDGVRAGVLTYDIVDRNCEIVSLNSVDLGKGIGSSLIETLKKFAIEAHYACVWLVTSNDNIDALRFYQKRGFRITKVYSDAIDAARKVKPQIPLIGNYDIPMKDAIELKFPVST